MSSIAIPKPFDVDGTLYVTSGYIMDKKKPLYAIRPGASGDISLEGDETANDYIVWTQKQAGPYHPTPLAYDGQIYVLLDRGFLAAYDVKTGEEVYKRQRIPNGRAFTSSPFAYGGKIFCMNEDGVCFVCQAGPRQCKRAGSNRGNPTAEPGMSTQPLQGFGTGFQVPGIPRAYNHVI